MPEPTIRICYTYIHDFSTLWPNGSYGNVKDGFIHEFRRPQILDCFTIPCVMALSALFLRARYTAHHYAGVVVSVAGICALLLADSDAMTSTRPLVGDAMCLVGAFLYAISNVGQVRFEAVYSNSAFGCSSAAAWSSDPKYSLAHLPLAAVLH